MAIWTLAEIRHKVRQVTGRLNSQELSNQQVDNYINQYYQYTFPAEVKLDQQFTYYQFLTTPNQAYYDLPIEYTNLVPPATINGEVILWCQDPNHFYTSSNMQKTTPWIGDGTTQVFTTNVQGLSIMPGTVVVTDNIEVFEDVNHNWTTSDRVITGSLGGNVILNYVSGVVTVVFATPPIEGKKIYFVSELFNQGMPQSVLIFNNQLQFSPVPDTHYKFQCKAYKAVSSLVSDTDHPTLDEWGPCIAYGAARNIHSDFGELDAYAEITALYKEQVSYILARSYQNLLDKRAGPDF